MRRSDGHLGFGVVPIVSLLGTANNCRMMSLSFQEPSKPSEAATPYRLTLSVELKGGVWDTGPALKEWSDTHDGGQKPEG